MLWLCGLLWFAEGIDDFNRNDGAFVSDAIVVLTGGSERLGAGFDLLSHGKGHKLFISGVYRGVHIDQIMMGQALSPELLSCCVVLGHRAENTEGNAEETAEWMKSEGLKSMRLVTSNYHMRRSLIEFHRAMPNIKIIPHPVSAETVRLEEWWRWPGTAELIVTEYNKYLGALVRNFWYENFK